MTEKKTSEVSIIYLIMVCIALAIGGYTVNHVQKKKAQEAFEAEMEARTIQQCEDMKTESGGRLMRMSPIWKNYPFYKDCLARGYVYPDHL